MITTIDKIMTKNLITVQIGATLDEANQLMLAKRIRHLPITDKVGYIIGILSQRDLQYVPNSKHILVEMMMSSPVHFLSEKTSVKKAIFNMLEKKISCILIGDEVNQASGIITTDDLLWFAAHLLNNESEEGFTLLSAKMKQTIGEIARELSNAGI